MESLLKVGISKVNVTPPTGIELAGYYQTRIANGVLDELQAVALAVNYDKTTVVFVAIDCLGVSKDFADLCKGKITEKTGLDGNAVFIHGTHTHTGPKIDHLSNDKLTKDYAICLIEKVADAVMLALKDLKPAKMGYGVGKAPNISFVRRFTMKDGSTKTNPGVNNPDIVCPKGDVDERVNVLRFDRENAETVVLVNFGTHPDTTGGTKISGDWPSFVRKYVEQSIDNTKCIFFNGAEGDVNHVNVHPKAGDFNDMFNDFDGCSRGYGHARHMGRVITGAVLQVYDKVNYTEVDGINYTFKAVEFNTNKGTAEELVQARKYMDLHNAGRDDEIPFKAMMLTTVLAKSNRMIMLENAPEKLPMYFTALRIGKVALFGIPGEPFTDIGRALKQTDGYEMVIPCCLVNGYNGYFPLKDSFDEGGYEGLNSRWSRGTAEKMIEEGKNILKTL